MIPGEASADSLVASRRLSPGSWLPVQHEILLAPSSHPICYNAFTGTSCPQKNTENIMNYSTLFAF